MSRRKVLLLSSLAVLALLLVFGCSLPLRDDSGAPASEGWYIKLQIKAPAASKGIAVTDFDVIGLKIQVRDPEDEVLQTIDWAVEEGAQSYLVPVKRLGEHEIEVTHYGERDGEEVEAVESAAFDIQAMVITVIDIVPGCIGVIQIEGEELQPEIDLTGYWDSYLKFADGSEMGPDVSYIKQAGSTLDMLNGLGTINGPTISVQAWIEDWECYLVVTGTVFGEELTGSITGFPFGGGSATFRMVRSTVTFGRLDLEGTCEEVPISLHTDYGYGSGGETISTYTHSFSLNWNSFWGNLRFVNTGQLSAGSYPVTSDGPEEPGQIQAILWDGNQEHTASEGTVEITEYDGSRMVGGFSLSFPEGNLTGSFSLTLGSNNGQVSMNGPWQGTTNSSYSEVSVWTRTPFEIEYTDNELSVTLWLHVTGELRTGEFRDGEAWVDLNWGTESGPGANGYPADAPGNYLSITSYSQDGIGGSFQQAFQEGGTVTGSFNVSFRN